MHSSCMGMGRGMLLAIIIIILTQFTLTHAQLTCPNNSPPDFSRILTYSYCLEYPACCDANTEGKVLAEMNVIFAGINGSLPENQECYNAYKHVWCGANCSSSALYYEGTSNNPHDVVCNTTCGYVNALCAHLGVSMTCGDGPVLQCFDNGVPYGKHAPSTPCTPCTPTTMLCHADVCMHMLCV